MPFSAAPRKQKSKKGTGQQVNQLSKSAEDLIREKYFEYWQKQQVGGHIILLQLFEYTLYLVESTSTHRVELLSDIFPKSLNSPCCLNFEV